MKILPTQNSVPIADKKPIHRITFKHFIFHDILHGIWHFEKGIVFTIKEAFTRPGQAAADYISGKRIKYYNVFYLNLLIIGFNIFFAHILEKLDAKYNTVTSEVLTTIGQSKFNAFIENYSKILIFCLIPLFAFNGYLLFRKAKYNLSEHLILSGIVILGIMCITTIGNSFLLFDYTQNFVIISDIANIMTPTSILIYIFYSYHDAFKKVYSKNKLILRSSILCF